jgi:hypothetical protein
MAGAPPPIPGNKPVFNPQTALYTGQPQQTTINSSTTMFQYAELPRTNTLPINLVNNTSSPIVYAYITGFAIDNNNAVFILQANGRTPYYPPNPSQILTPLSVNCSIPLGPPGHTITAAIPRIAGGRIWFSIGTPLIFLLNPGGDNRPGLVEPSVTNPNDPNYHTDWGFMEFTYNAAEMYANISFVDFVSLPISISLTNTSWKTQTVPGLPTQGLSNIAAQLESQTKKDGMQAWADLIVRKTNGSVLRVLSPNNGMVLKPGDFGGYYDAYVNQVMVKYASNTHGETMNASLSGQPFTGHTNSITGTITLGHYTFNRPSTADIFSSNTGPFQTGSDVTRNNLIPQLAAAFNRSTLLLGPNMPAPARDFYGDVITNHYSRIVHGVVIEGRGYAFPYDDVAPSSGQDQSGFVNDVAPRGMTVTVGQT